LAIFFIAETFFGWESAIFLASETKNPTKVMPKALIYGTLVIAVLSFLLAFTAMGTIPWADFANSVAPLKDLGTAHFGAIGGVVFAILIFISVIGATAGWIVTAPRLLMSIAEDKLFFTQFAKIHPKHKSPYVSIFFQAIVVSILVIVGAGSYETLLHMLIPLILLVYSAVLMSVVILRFKQPDLKRPYRVIFGKVGPFVTVLFMMFLLVMFIRETHSALDILRISAGLVLFGIPAYFAIELFYEQKYIELRKNIMAKILHYYGKIPLTNSSFNKIISFVGPFNKKSSIVVFNSSMGAFTSKILSSKYNFKKIYVANHSGAEVEVFKEKIHPTARNHISVHKVRGYAVPKAVSKVSAFVSFNDLGHVKNIEKFLKQVTSVLVSKGKFCFYVKNHFLNMSVNANEINDKDKILKIFKKVGLKANFVRKGKLYKSEVFIYGSKK